MTVCHEDIRNITKLVEGGTWQKGRHTSGEGYQNDCEKYAEAVLLGWTVIRATTQQVTSGTALKWVERALRL